MGIYWLRQPGWSWFGKAIGRRFVWPREDSGLIGQVCWVTRHPHTGAGELPFALSDGDSQDPGPATQGNSGCVLGFLVRGHMVKKIPFGILKQEWFSVARRVVQRRTVALGALCLDPNTLTLGSSYAMCWLFLPPWVLQSWYLLFQRHWFMSESG